MKGIMQGFIYRNVSEYCSFWPSSSGNDEQESRGRMILNYFTEIFDPFFFFFLNEGQPWVQAKERKIEMENVKRRGGKKA